MHSTRTLIVDFQCWHVSALGEPAAFQCTCTILLICLRILLKTIRCHKQFWFQIDTFQKRHQTEDGQILLFIFYFILSLFLFLCFFFGRAKIKDFYLTYPIVIYRRSFKICYQCLLTHDSCPFVTFNLLLFWIRCWIEPDVDELN